MVKNTISEPQITSLKLNAQTIRSLIKCKNFASRKRQFFKQAVKASIPLEISLIKKCNTKKAFKELLLSLTPYWKTIVKHYILKCFVFDVYNRKVECKLQLLAKKETLFAVVDEPMLLDFGCHFDNNLVKNFCTGLSNFVKKFHEQLSKAVGHNHEYKRYRNSDATMDMAETDQQSNNDMSEQWF